MCRVLPNFVVFVLLVVSVTTAENDGLNPNPNHSGSLYRHRGVKHRRRYVENTTVDNLESPSVPPPHVLAEVPRFRQAGPAEGLGRISEHLTALAALDEQQLKRLENLEYKLTKLEVQSLDKTEAIRAEVRELTRRAQQQDWQSARNDATLDAVRTDTAFLRQEAEHRSGGSESDRASDRHNQDLAFASSELQTLRTEVAALRKESLATRTELHRIKTNVTKITAMTADMLRDSQNYITKQYFNAALQDLKQSLRSYDMAVKATYSAARSSAGGIDASMRLPVDCWSAYLTGAANISGPYRIHPHGSERSVFAYCDQDRWGGGWTVLQTRFDGSTDFYRTYRDYVHGFGNIAGEHWLGLETMHLLTSHNLYELLIDLQDFDETWTYAHYSSFALGSEAQGYPITILGDYTGDAGDSFTYQAGHKFSARDLDNDNWPEGSCAQAHHGAWWYHACEQSNLNGLYLSGPVPEDVGNKGMYWFEFHGPAYSLKASRIMIRPVGAVDWQDKSAIKYNSTPEGNQLPATIKDNMGFS